MFYVHLLKKNHIVVISNKLIIDGVADRLIYREADQDTVEKYFTYASDELPSTPLNKAHGFDVEGWRSDYCKNIWTSNNSSDNEDHSHQPFEQVLDIEQHMQLDANRQKLRPVTAQHHYLQQQQQHDSYEYLSESSDNDEETSVMHFGGDHGCGDGLLLNDKDNYFW